MSKTAIKSQFALLDVPGKKRSSDLEKRLEKDGPIEVVIRAKITESWGVFDGISREFECTVLSVEEAPTPALPKE